MNFADTLRQAIARREQLVDEIAKIDADMAEVRQVLGLPPEKRCPICMKTFTPASSRQRMCDGCRDENPHRAVEDLVERRKDPDPVPAPPAPGDPPDPNPAVDRLDPVARDNALHDVLKRAGANGVSFVDIQQRMPRETDLTHSQRHSAIRNGLTRLKTKGLARIDNDGRWRAQA